MTFGDRLRNLRVSRKMTQQELADRLNISQSAIAAYEKNLREPSFSMIQRLADYFGVTFSSMIPADDTADNELVQIVADSLNSNPKLVALFKVARDLRDQDLDVLTYTAKSFLKQDS